MTGTLNNERISREAMTAEEFAVWWNESDDDDAKYELDRGIAVAKNPYGSELHGVVCATLIHHLTDYVLRTRCGGYMLANNTGSVLERSPDTVYRPDAMLYLQPPRRGFTDFFAMDLPTLAIEVLDPNDDRDGMRKRSDRMVSAGIPLVWVVDPEKRCVMIHSQNQEYKTLDETDELTGDGILPGFACKVGDFFAWPTQPSATPGD